MGNVTSFIMPRVSTERANIQPHNSFYSPQSHLLTNLASSYQQEGTDQQNLSLSLIQKTTLGLGSAFSPDINATTTSQPIPTNFKSPLSCPNCWNKLGRCLLITSFKLHLSDGGPKAPKPRKLPKEMQQNLLKELQVSLTKEKTESEISP